MHSLKILSECISYGSGNQNAERKETIENHKEIGNSRKMVRALEGVEERIDVIAQIDHLFLERF